MDDFLNEKNIDVEEIMQKVKEKMDRDKAQPDYRNSNVWINGAGRDKNLDHVKSEIDFLLDNWNIENNQYTIYSHRKLIGPALIKGRQLVHDEVGRYVNPMFAKQSEFNLSVARTIDYTLSKTESLKQDIDEKSRTIRQEVSSVFDKVVDEKMIAIDRDLQDKSWLAKMLEECIQSGHMTADTTDSWDGDVVNYCAFEEKFRGPSQDIKQRQSAFIDYFIGCKNVLDIGCGRGEFLELMGENGVTAIGIDVDDNMVKFCIHKGLDVKKIDAISYLESLDDESLDGIFIDQVVEHLEPKYLIKMLVLCFQKIKPGYYIFAETVNPVSLTSFANFYIDMTHKKPVHPETLKFLIETAGFKETAIKFFAPVSEDSRLKKIKIDLSLPKNERDILEVYNHNIEKLNDILFGAQDYAVIGKK